MNILYLGPFQKNNSIGYTSSVILEDLCNINEHNVYAYPIYSGYDNPALSSIPYFRFKEIKKYPDINIQHSTINSLYIDRYSKNYFMPIIPLNLETDKRYLQKLKQVDKIFVYSDFEVDKFIKYGINKEKIFKLKPPNIKISSNNLEIGIYKQYTKYYFIGDYTNNKNIINSLITNFLNIAKKNRDICLIIASECEQSEKKELITFYENQKKQLSLTNKEDKILLLIDDLSLDRIHGLHNSADIFLCLNDGNYPITDFALAKACGNSIISYPSNDIDIYEINNNTFYRITNTKIRELIQSQKSENNTTYPSYNIQEVL